MQRDDTGRASRASSKRYSEALSRFGEPPNSRGRATPTQGFGTIISFEVRGDDRAADAVCAGLQLIQHATSLGAVESTIERRASVPGQEHLPPALLRLSVGIEAVEDLWTDLDRALRKVPEV